MIWVVSSKYLLLLELSRSKAWLRGKSWRLWQVKVIRFRSIQRISQSITRATPRARLTSRILVVHANSQQKVQANLRIVLHQKTIHGKITHTIIKGKLHGLRLWKLMEKQRKLISHLLRLQWRIILDQLRVPIQHMSYHQRSAKQ